MRERRIVEHLFVVRRGPAGIGGVAVKPAAQLVVNRASCHLLERVRNDAQRLLVARPAVITEQQLRTGFGKFSGALPKPPKTGSKVRARARAQLWSGSSLPLVTCKRCAISLLAELFGARRGLLGILDVAALDLLQQAQQPLALIAVTCWKIRALRTAVASPA